MTPFLTILAVLIAVAALWTLSGWLPTRKIEQPFYKTLKKIDGLEIRQYKAFILAETEVSGDYESALNEGFMTIADYIFGNNKSRSQISMTSPVKETAKETASEKISMTSPVKETAKGKDKHIIAFVMPAKYTLQTLPSPNTTRIKFREQPSCKVAVLRFSWWSGSARIARKKALLLEKVAKGHLKAKSPPSYAGYNPPWTPPWLRRNEVMVEVE